MFDSDLLLFSLARLQQQELWDEAQRKGEGKMIEVNLGTLCLSYGVVFLAGMVTLVVIIASSVGK